MLPITRVSGASQMRVLVLTVISLISAISNLSTGEAPNGAAGDWAFYGGDAGGSRYSPPESIMTAPKRLI